MITWATTGCNETTRCTFLLWVANPGALALCLDSIHFSAHPPIPTHRPSPPPLAVAHRPREQDGVLGDDGHAGPQQPEGHCGDVHPVNGDAAALHTQHPEQRQQQRRLAAARAPADPNALPPRPRCEVGGGPGKRSPDKSGRNGPPLGQVSGDGSKGQSPSRVRSEEQSWQFRPRLVKKKRGKQ